MTTDQTTAEQTSDAPTDAAHETDEWVFPLDEVIDAHRDRITPDNEEFIPFMIEAWRTGDPAPRWTTVVGQTDDNVNAREAGLRAVEVMAASTDADFMVFVYDTHATTLQNNPKTGQPWKQGEMQAMCDEEGFCETGLMRDNLVVTVARRSDRRLYTRFLPYHFHQGKPILYEETTMSEWEPDSAEQIMSGRIPDAMRAAVAQPTLDEMLGADIGGGLDSPQFREKFGAIDPDEARMHSLIAGVQALYLTAHLAGLPGMYAFLIPAFTEAEKRMLNSLGLSLDDLGGDAEDDEETAEGNAV